MYIITTNQHEEQIHYLTDASKGCLTWHPNRDRALEIEDEKHLRKVLKELDGRIVPTQYEIVEIKPGGDPEMNLEEQYG
jgi:hypothetical protein